MGLVAWAMLRPFYIQSNSDATLKVLCDLAKVARRRRQRAIATMAPGVIQNISSTLDFLIFADAKDSGDCVVLLLERLTPVPSRYQGTRPRAREGY